jgi:hypothetical protein
MKMRKAVVAAIVGVGLLAGCITDEGIYDSYDYDAYNRETAERLERFRSACENDRGIEIETPEMASCIMEMGRQTPRIIQSPTYTPTPQQKRNARIARTRAEELTRIRQVCINDYGHGQGTPELAQCVQLIDTEQQRLRQEGIQALGQALSSMAPSTTTCNTTYGGGFARTNCY